jgi:hypothetical protein
LDELLIDERMIESFALVFLVDVDATGYEPNWKEDDASRRRSGAGYDRATGADHCDGCSSGCSCGNHTGARNDACILQRPKGRAGLLFQLRSRSAACNDTDQPGTLELEAFDA